MTPEDVKQAVRELPASTDYVWDGQDEDDRPATAEELQAALAAARRRRGRPAGSGTKEQVALRVDRDVLAAFRAGGPGWQTRMNDALRDWLRTHPQK
ncbi:BrnA antitoxin family protein [Azohydromonas aeria]|uniref:BrnA antitoxin family protein n=1 Tax=Azohydromonas aeria TaxID=2590212 RepID=UPI0012F94077|nr:BrnA antitoxin family protein [Azohydromonas aeria]